MTNATKPSYPLNVVDNACMHLDPVIVNANLSNNSLTLLLKIFVVES